MKKVKKNSAVSSGLKFDYPYSMLVGPGAEFIGGRIIDIFRSWVYYFILTTFKIKSLLEKNDKKHKNNSNKILFVVRDWGVSTTLNVDIFESLSEYCGDNNVTLLKVLKYDKIVYDLNKELKSNNYSHIIFDTRVMLTKNGFFSAFRSLYDCCSMAKIIHDNNAVCLCGMTDFQPGYKLQAELLTSYGGLIICWPDISSGFFPLRHSRFVGPLFSPKSQKTITRLMNSDLSEIPKSDVVIMGANYEPRKSLVEKLVPWLQVNEIPYYINTRKDLEAISYLNVYRNAKISFNTNWVVNRTDRYHFVGRNFEIALTGSLLLTQSCHGLDLFLEEGRDYIGFNSFDDLVEKVNYYLSNEKERIAIATSGQKKVLDLFKINFVWNEVDKALRIHHLRKIGKNNSTECQ